MDGLIIGLLLPFAGTTLGAACVFLMKKQMPDLVQKTLLGFASGVMVAASVWSLLIPSIEMSGTENATRVIPAVSGFIAGIAFLLLMDRITPHLHLGSPSPEGPHSKLSRTSMLVLAVTLHNIPEGMAVGVALAAAMEHSTYLPMAGALALSLGIAIQNFPEGAIVSMPLRSEGNSRLRAFGIGTLSGVVEPIGAILTILLAAYISPHIAIFTVVCRWRYDLCGRRGVDSGGFSRKTFQRRNGRLCTGLRINDDSGRRIRINVWSDIL